MAFCSLRRFWLAWAWCAGSAFAQRVPQWETLDLVLEASSVPANPFTGVRVTAALRSPAGRLLSVRGVYDGGRRWLVRAAFDEPGTWSVTTQADPPDASLATTWNITVGPPLSRGPVRLAPEDNGFAFADGSPFFHAGDTCYVLAGLDREQQRLPYLRRRAAQGFSHIRLQAAVLDARFPHLWAWGGTRESPDLDRLNPAYFQHLDSVMRDLRAHGLLGEIILLNYYRDSGLMADPKVWTRQRERLWLDYVVARYAAFDNLLYWTVANEFEVYPDGVYRLDPQGDAAWARETAAYVKSIDPYRHPITVHPYSRASTYARLFTTSPEIDFLMVQEHGAEAKSDPWLSDGDGAGLEEKMALLRATGKVVVNAESGYEWDGSTKRGSNVSSELLRRHAWRIVMGGANFSAGFRRSVFNFREITFDVENGGRPGAGYIATLAGFFRQRTRFEKLRPRHELTTGAHLCLASAREYVLLAAARGPVRLDLRDLAGDFASSWLNPITGETRPGPEGRGGGIVNFESPWPEAVLHVTPPLVVRAAVDGGWPRVPSALAEQSDGRFVVDPRGHDRYVSVEIENRSSQRRPVTLGGWPVEFGRRRDGPPRHYYWMKPPGGVWQRRSPEDGRLRFDAAPGLTRVATVPAFTHADYQGYVASMNDPRLRKDVVLSSGAGAYPVHRLRITNPARPGPKLRIGFSRASHAYEHAGYYMAQGAIEWLLSGDAAANLDAIEWTFYPCPDPQAIHDGRNYIEHDELRLDDGRRQVDALWDPATGQIPSERFHVLTVVHMWEAQDYESYKYHDPFAPSGRAGNGKSAVERVMLAFWPYWFEFGIDAYDHENKWGAANARPENFGGALVTHLEIPFYGKDDADPIQRLRQQGRHWARSHAQAFLRMQQDRNYWTGLRLGDAVLLPEPRHLLLEDRIPPRRPLTIFHEPYAHGVGHSAGQSLDYLVPENCTAAVFHAMVALDDADTSDARLTFIAEAAGRELWRSRELGRHQRQLAAFAVPAGERLVLRATGREGALADWGGARLTCDDPEAGAR